MKSQEEYQDKKVQFNDEMQNKVIVTGATTLDEAVEAADAFLEEHGLCVKNGGKFYGSTVQVDEKTYFNVG